MQWTWFSFLGWSAETIIGTPLVISGDNITPELKNERALVIMNHRTRLDWVFLLGFWLREFRLWNFRAIVKDDLKYMLPFGWPMQLAGFIFLARNWEQDRSYLHQVLGHLGQTEYPAQLLVFPEGTDKTETTTARSNAYAAKEGLKKLDYLLHPRKTGFVYIVNQMRSYRNIDAIYDLTMGFQDRIPQSEKSFFIHNDKIGMPSAVHLHFKRYDINNLPTDETELGNWLQNLWYEKDERLAKFYQDPSPSFKQENGEPSVHIPKESSTTVLGSQVFGVGIWALLTMTCIYWLSNSFYFWYTVVGWVVLQGITYKFGIDKLELKFHYREHLEKKK